MILLSKALVSRFLLPAVSFLQTENTHSSYASDAGADSRSWAGGANSGYLLAFVTQNLSPLFSETQKVIHRPLLRIYNYRNLYTMGGLFIENLL